MKYPMYIVDAFIIEKALFSGNAAAVCNLNYDNDISDELKEKIASEMNLSETVFISNGWTPEENKTSGEDNKCSLKKTIRWFTPTAEVTLCGHATLASCLVLFNLYGKSVSENESEEMTIHFDTKFVGPVYGSVNRKTEKITINFPVSPPRPFLPGEFPWLSNHQIVEQAILGENSNLKYKDIEEFQFSPGLGIILVRLKDSPDPNGNAEDNEKLLKAVSPNFELLKEQLNLDAEKCHKNCLPSLTVTICGGRGVGGESKPDFYSRYHCPLNGINEDPVTGSLHCVNLPYWINVYEKMNLGKDKTSTFWARQSSARGGDLFCSLDDKDQNRVKISGNGSIFLKGEYNL